MKYRNNALSPQLLIFLLIIMTAWFFFLPSIIHAGEPVGWKDLGLYGGQVYDIAIDPVDTTIMFAGTWEGDGLFKSTDGGITWQSVEGFRNAAVFSIDFDPHNHTTIWVATWGAIYKSIDGGITWKSWWPQKVYQDCYYRALAIDPIDSNKIYVGVTDEWYFHGTIMKSTDGGESWEFLDLEAVYGVADIALNPLNPQEIWVVTGRDTFGEIYRSEDSGSTWSRIPTGLYEWWYNKIAINPLDPRIVVVGGADGLYITRDGGDTWRSNTWNLNFYLGYKNWCQALAFDPQNPNTIYANISNELFKSTDGGQTWRSHPISLHLFCLEVHPHNSQVLYGGDGNQGIYKSPDGGQTWSQLNQGIKANSVFDSAGSPGGNLLVGSVAGVFLKTGGGSWNQINSYLAFAVAFSPEDENLIYAGFDGALGKSADSGQNWTYASTLWGDERISSLAFDPQNSATIYVGCEDVWGSIFKSNDGGETLDWLSLVGDPVHDLEVNPNNPRILYAAAGLFYEAGSLGGVYRSNDGGETWEELSLPSIYSFTGRATNTLALDPKNPEILYAGCGGSDGSYAGLFKSTDGGITWEEKDFGIPQDDPIMDLEVDPNNSSIIYAATFRNGIYISSDAGNYWTLLGLSDYLLYDILVSPSGLSASKKKMLLGRESSSNLYAGSGSGLFEYSGSGTGALTGTITDAKTGASIAGAKLTTDTGGIALTLSGSYVMVAPAGQCTVIASKDGYMPSSQTGVTVTSGGTTTVDLCLKPIGNLYFPHIASGSGWETEIAIINPSGTQTINGALKAYNNSGQQVSNTISLILAPHGRREITIGSEFTNSDIIGYLIFETDSDYAKGYIKFYQQGISRAAIPATREINNSDIYIPHIASDEIWRTFLSLLNTTSWQIPLTIEFDNGTTKTVSLASQEHRAFNIAELFNGQPQPNIHSGVIKHRTGVIGLELFEGGYQLDGIPLTDDTATTLYYPHVTSDPSWWTGIVAYNPPPDNPSSPSSCKLTITPYSAEGTELTPTPQPLTLHEKGKYIGLVSNLNLPANTAWFQVKGTKVITGFELFGTTDGNQLAGFSGIGMGGKEGIFAKLEKNGWTGIAFVNTENSPATVTLTAYDNNGNPIANRILNLNGHEKKSDLAQNLFTQNISSATYIGYSSNREVVGFQLNGSSDGTMLDCLPGM